MSLFGDKKEIKSLGAIKGVLAKDITPDQIKAINEEFKSLGFEGIEVTHAGHVDSLATEITQKTEALKASEGKVTDLTAKVAELSKKPAAEPTNSGNAEDRIEDPNAKKQPWEIISDQVLDERL